METKSEKIELTKKEFDEFYSIIEPDTPQPDLDKLKEDNLSSFEQAIKDGDNELKAEFPNLEDE